MGHMIEAASKSTSSGGSYFFLIVIVAVLVLMYFVTVRPQRRRQQQVQQTQREIKPGQRVRTTAGMYATITAVEGDDIVLEVAPGVEVRYLRRAIMEVLPGDSDYEDSGSYEADEAVQTGEDAGDETAGQGESDVTAQAGDAGTAAVADTAGETETTNEAGTAPGPNGKNPADEGRPAGR